MNFVDPCIGTVTVLLKPVANTPQIQLRNINAQRSYVIEQIINAIRIKMRLPLTESIFLYVRTQFAPPLDARIGDLYDVSKLINKSLELQHKSKSHSSLRYLRSMGLRTSKHEVSDSSICILMKI